MNVMIFKLVTGENVIARASNDDENSLWTLEKPLLIGLGQDPNSGQVGIGFGEWLLAHRGGDITIHESKLVTDAYEADEPTEKMYTKQVSPIEIV